MSYAAHVAGLADSLTRQVPAAMLRTRGTGRVYRRDNLSPWLTFGLERR